MRLVLELLRPRYGFPKILPRHPLDLLAFWIATGCGIGFMSPASATWGSLFGLGYLLLWAALPGTISQVLVELAMIAASIWAAGSCERFCGQKDPSPVVIDEIVALPLAFWPLVQRHESGIGTWVMAFCLYRIADVMKPWPARYVERFTGGVGIVADDLVSATYVGALLFAWEWAVKRAT